MPSCCSDLDTVFTDNYEDGAPLAARYAAIVDGHDGSGDWPRLQSGVGINGSIGLQSDPSHVDGGVFDEIAVQFSLVPNAQSILQPLDLCLVCDWRLRWTTPCFGETWVARDGPEARARIAQADMRHRTYYQDKLIEAARRWG